MLSTIFLAAAPLSGRSPNYAAISLHKEFVGFTIELCSALQELCSVDSVKGAVNARWVWSVFVELDVWVMYPLSSLLIYHWLPDL